jgi:Na+/H+ antiporter NhaD/arsenite permease-like protein
MNSQLQVIIATTVFLSTYALIISEKINRTVVALLGAMLVLFFGIIDQQDAIAAIDFNTLGLLIGMMIIVNITGRTGVFEYIAIKAVKLAKGDPWLIMLSLAIITGLVSSLLDNVTSVLLIVPITLSITRDLDLDPLPFLITQILASNIGGASTLIGDPPNIMIGSATGLGFGDFIVNLLVPALITFMLTMVCLRFIYRSKLALKNQQVNKALALNEQTAIKDYALLKKSVIVLLLTIIGFTLHQFVHLESATIALSGATLLLLITKEEPEDVLLGVEWPTIFFFIGLFILVGALEHVGVIDYIAQKALSATGGSKIISALSILWLSAFGSAFVDNIPFVATMIPLIQKMGQLGGISDLNPLWWSLSLGACLGGNGTLVGASANMIVAGLAEKQGVPISFRYYLKICFPLMIMSIVVSSIYIYFAYLL